MNNKSKEFCTVSDVRGALLELRIATEVCETPWEARKALSRLLTRSPHVLAPLKEANLPEQRSLDNFAAEIGGSKGSSRFGKGYRTWLRFRFLNRSYSADKVKEIMQRP